MFAGFAERLFDLAQAFRFGLVGIAATLVYLGAVNLVAVPVGPLSPFHAHLLGLACSIGISYGGHHAYTFARKGRHRLYFRRFATITAVLYVLASAVAFVCDHYLHLSAALISLLVAVLYPGVSYLAHALWTFAEVRATGSAPLPP